MEIYCKLLGVWFALEKLKQLINGKCKAASRQLKSTMHLMFANGNNACVYLHIKWGSEIQSKAVAGDERGDAFQCHMCEPTMKCISFKTIQGRQFRST